MQQQPRSCEKGAKVVEMIDLASADCPEVGLVVLELDDTLEKERMRMLYVLKT